jgi:hypothetical protein
MKTSTIIAGASALVLAGVGAYLYFKGKKATTPNDSATPPSSATPPISASNSDVNSSLGLPTTTTYSTDEQKNYLEAKDLARILLLNLSTWSEEYKILMTKYGYSWKSPSFVKNKATQLGTKIVTKRINALGYKLLPNFDIEKM